MEEISFDISHTEFDPETQEKIDTLIATIDQQPRNEVPVLKLASTYAQVWAGSHDPEIVLRVFFCLERAIKIASGRFEKQTRQLISGLRQRAEHSGMQQISDRLDELEDALDTRLKQIQQEEMESPESAMLKEMPAEMEMPDEPAIETSDGTEQAVPEPVGAFPEEWNKPLEDDLEQETPKGREKAKESQAIINHISGLIDEGQLHEALRAYTDLNNSTVKRNIADKMISEIPSYGVEPVFALAAIEDDKQVFRYIMRRILKFDRNAILDDIDLESYSTDLQHVAIVVLSRLNIRSAVPNLKEALFMNDVLVRSVAVHGLATTGKPSEETLELIAETAEKDPHPKVRLAAAKALQTADSAESFTVFYRYSLEATYDPKIQDILQEMCEKFDPEEEARKEIEASVRENREMNKEHVKRIAKVNTEKNRVSIEDDLVPWYKKITLSPEGIATLKAELLARKKILVTIIVLSVVLVGGGILMWPWIVNTFSEMTGLLKAVFPGLRPAAVD